MDYLFGAALGLAFGFFITIVFLLPTSPKWMEENRSIVYTTDTGVVCKANKSYPKINCKLIQEAVGPKLNTFEEKE